MRAEHNHRPLESVRRQKERFLPKNIVELAELTTTP